MSLKRNISVRVGIVYLLMLVLGVLIASKVVFLQFINDDVYKEKAAQTLVKNRVIEAHRGDIYGDNMRLLASSIPYYKLYVDFKTSALVKDTFYKHVDSLAYKMADLFKDRSYAEYKQTLVAQYQKGNRYYLLKKNVNYIELKKLRQFPIFRKGRYKGGLIVEQQTVRKLPHQSLAKRTLGSFKNDSNKVGIEGAFNTYLAGQQGYMRMQKIASNVWMPLDDDESLEPVDGSSLISTLNVDLQDVAEEALRKQLKMHNAEYGTTILMEVKTGDIKAIVNLKKYESGYYEAYNYAIGQSTEPGSTFKLPVLMCAIEDGYVDITDSIETGNGRFEVYDMDFSDDKFGGYGTITVQQVLEKSSNVGMAKIVTRYYGNNPQKLIDRLYSMNLNNKLNIPIKGEGRAHIPYPNSKYWSEVSIASISRGYEVSLTPLQILTFYNAVANDGVMVKPRFIKEVRKHGKLERVFHTEVINPSICSKSTLKKARQMLEGVVEHGTASNLRASSLKIAGKTGTAQLYREGGYEHDGKLKYQASFCGYFPADNPKYSCIVVIAAPSQNGYYGNQAAGPVFREIADKVYSSDITLIKSLNDQKKQDKDLPYSKCGSYDDTRKVLSTLNIKTEDKEVTTDWINTQKEEDEIMLSNRRIIDNLMPNVVGMGAKDAVYLLENLGLHVQLVGRGNIKKQSILSGSRIHEGQKVILELSFIES